MCTKDNLVRGISTSGWFMLILALVLLILGSVLAGSSHYHQLLGTSIRDIGGGVIFVSLLYPFASAMAIYSAQYHNKFVLLIFWVSLIIIVSIQLLLGGLALGKTVPSVPYTVQHNCLLMARPPIPGLDAICKDYFDSDLFAGINLAWNAHYFHSLTNDGYVVAMQKLQRTNYCCGLSRPEYCTENTNPFPSFLPSDRSFMVHGSMQKNCSDRAPRMYWETAVCKGNGGCSFDMPMGTCGTLPSNVRSRGCADVLHLELASQIAAVANIIMVLTAFPILFIVMAICLCLKRKSEDVMPPLEFAAKNSKRVLATQS